MALSWIVFDVGHISHNVQHTCNMALSGMVSHIGQIGNYRQVSNISRTLVGNKIVDHSDVVGASPVGAVPTTSSFST